jgi:ParB-like chromosome segregation protein Spo0J
VNIRNRVKELRYVPASQLQPNPKNWRTHPEAQQNALRGILAEVGIAGAVLARETPEGGLMLIDGHLRTDVMHDQEIPVLVLDVDEAEADKLLATIDPLGAMAEADADKLRELLEEVETASEALADMFTELAEEAGMFDAGEVDAPELADGDREPFQQMTFTLHDSQVEALRVAINAAKAAGPFDGSPNENSNGNALARIAEAYCGSC